MLVKQKPILLKQNSSRLFRIPKFNLKQTYLMNFTSTSSWVRLGLPLSIFMLLALSAIAQTAKPTLIKDIKLGNASSSPIGFTQLNNKVYFTAEGDFGGIYTASNRRIFSMANGAAVPQIVPTNVGNGTIFLLEKPFVLNNELFYNLTRSYSSTNAELWKTNGTTETFVDTLANFSSTRGSVYDNKFYFTGSSTSAPIGRSYDLFRHTGVKGSRQLVAKMLRGDTLPTGSFFNFWKEEVSDYYPTPNVTFYDVTNDSSNLTNNLRGFRRTIRAFDHITGLTKDLYSINWRGDFGATTNLLTTYKVLGAVNSKLLFTSKESSTNIFPPVDTLFSLDKTGVKTVVQIGAGSPLNIINLGNRLIYLDAYNQLWETDGTAAGTRSLFRGIAADIYTVNGQVFYRTTNTTYVPTPKVVHHIWSLSGVEIGSFENTVTDNDQLVIYKDDKNLFFVPQKTDVDTVRRYVYQVGDAATPFKQIGLLAKCKRDPNNAIPTTPIDTTCPCLTIIASNVPFTPTPFTVIDSTLLFVAYDNTYGGEVWRMNLSPLSNPPNPCATDTVKPIWANCPANIPLTTTGTTAIGIWTNPTATDNCGVTATFPNYTSGTTFGLGTTTVTYTALDAKNNAGLCTFTVTVTSQVGVPNCTSKSNAPWNEWVASVQLGIFTNTSAKTRDDRFVVGYSDWTDKTINVTRGQVYPFILLPGLSWSGYQSSLFFRAWIDYNNNGIFETSEMVLEQMSLSSGVNQPVTVPTTAFLGAVKMRVSMKKDAYPTACETFAAGEVEDYTVQIADITANPCATDATPPVLTNCPANISLTTTTTTAIGTWTAPTATDNCTATPSVSSTYNIGFAFPIGTTIVTYTAKDALNNTANCTFTVIVTQQVTGGGDVCTSPAASVTTGANSIIISGISTSAAVVQIFTNTWTPVYNQQVSGVSVTIPNIPTGTYIVKVTKLGTGGTWPAVCTVQIDNVVVSAGTNPCATDTIKPVWANCPANITLTTTGTTAIGIWTNPTATDNCGVIATFPNYTSGTAFGLGTTTVTYTALDAKNNAGLCSFTVTVTQQIIGGGANDIGLTIIGTPSLYRQWTPITVRVSAKNNGTTAMTNVKIELKRPLKTASGGTKTPSVGTFNDYCAGGIECSEWVIPSLTAGATATLDAPFFVLDATLPIVVTTNLLASTPTDATVANNTATVSIAPQTPLAAPLIAQLVYQKPTQLIPIVVQRIAPNPTDGELIMKLESLDAREVTFEFFNALGKLVKTEKRTVDKGVNRVEFDVYDLEQGVHFVIPTTTQGYKVPTKFVKM